MPKFPQSIVVYVASGIALLAGWGMWNGYQTIRNARRDVPVAIAQVDIAWDRQCEAGDRLLDGIRAASKGNLSASREDLSGTDHFLRLQRQWMECTTINEKLLLMPLMKNSLSKLRDFAGSCGNGASLVSSITRLDAATRNVQMRQEQYTTARHRYNELATGALGTLLGFEVHQDILAITTDRAGDLASPKYHPIRADEPG